jgi:hypothetical protein
VPEQPAGATVPVPQTVEAVVRTQLSNALGGKRGVLESALPTIAFTLTWVTTHQLKPALLAGAAAAVLLLAVRVAQRQPVQYVLNAVVGIGIAAIFALRSGRAEDAFLPGILYNAGYAVVLAVSVLVRWPAVGFLIGAVTGDPTGWRSNPAVVSLCAKLTWLLALPCALRVVVQYPPLGDRTGGLARCGQAGTRLAAAGRGVRGDRLAPHPQPHPARATHRAQPRLGRPAGPVRLHRPAQPAS